MYHTGGYNHILFVCTGYIMYTLKIDLMPPAGTRYAVNISCTIALLCISLTSIDFPRPTIRFP